MTKLNNDEAFFRRETASEIHNKTFGNSKGKEKLRCDLVDWVYQESNSLNDRIQIISNQFCVALEEDHFVNAKVAKEKTGWFRVAVNVDAKTDKYAIFNLASLSKRLEVPEKELKDKEKNGGLDAIYIKEKLDIQLKKQKELLFNIETFIEKPNIVDDSLFYKQIELFVNEEFSADISLQKKLDAWHKNQKFVESSNNPNKDAVNLLNHQMFKAICLELRSKLCVAPSNYLPTKKVVNKTTLKDAVWTTTNKSKEKVLLLRGQGLDKTKDPDRKYSIEIKPFVYASNPPTSSKEVPLKIPNQDGWVLASIESLKWLDLTEDRIRELSRLNVGDSGNSDMSQLDVAIQSKLHQISDEIEVGQKMKQQLADAYNESISAHARAIPKAIKLIDDVYNIMASSKVSQIPLTFDSFKQMCEQAKIEHVGSENSIISTLLIAAQRVDDRKFGIVLTGLLKLTNEKLNMLQGEEKLIVNLDQISDISGLKLMGSLDLIVTGRKLKEKCKMYEKNVQEVEIAGELLKIKNLNRNNKFKDTTNIFIECIYETVINRENNMQSHFNIHPFETAIGIVIKKFPKISPKKLINLVNKAAILEAANSFDDEQLGLIKTWFNSNDFDTLMGSLQESLYISSNPYLQENIFSNFKDIIDEISETEPFFNSSEDLHENTFEKLDEDDPFNMIFQ